MFLDQRGLLSGYTMREVLYRISEDYLQFRKEKTSEMIRILKRTRDISSRILIPEGIPPHLLMHYFQYKRKFEEGLKRCEDSPETVSAYEHFILLYEYDGYLEERELLLKLIRYHEHNKHLLKEETS